MYYSNKCQLFCTCEQSAGGKRYGKQVITETCKQCDDYDATGGEIDFYGKIMNTAALNRRK